LIVVDASVTLAWGLKDEESAFADAILERVTTEGAAVPAHWPLEVANGLMAAERRGRIAADQVAQIGRGLDELTIDIRPVELSTAFWGVLDAAREHGLSVYDAAYLDLCRSRGLPLATLDARLRSACEKVGVDLVR
jgi:predicted nucleic acid-binding protein